MEDKNTYDFESLEDLKKHNIIQDYRFKFDEENGILDIYVVPIMTAKYINVNFTLTPSGATFN